MSQNGQAPLFDLGDVRQPVVAIPAEYPDRARIPPHRHSTAQLVHAVRGVMTVETADGLWVVPPERGLWVPPRTSHSIRMRGAVAMRTVYFHAEVVPDAPERCAVVGVSTLLREILLRAVAFSDAPPSDGPEARLVAVLLDEIRAAPVAPLHLPSPKDPRLTHITRALTERPEDGRGLEEWAPLAGASARTLSRLFRRETGMTFGSWRQQARLLRSLELLAAGAAVTTVALDLGYDSPSAFVAMFRRALGTTPGRYFRETRGASPPPREVR